MHEITKSVNESTLLDAAYIHRSVPALVDQLASEAVADVEALIKERLRDAEKGKTVG